MVTLPDKPLVAAAIVVLPLCHGFDASERGAMIYQSAHARYYDMRCLMAAGVVKSACAIMPATEERARYAMLPRSMLDASTMICYAFDALSAVIDARA